jgi:hypothetical protein
VNVSMTSQGRYDIEDELLVAYFHEDRRDSMKRIIFDKLDSDLHLQ